jgi:polysaccharide export outer membrane protein
MTANCRLKNIADALRKLAGLTCVGGLLWMSPAFAQTQTPAAAPQLPAATGLQPTPPPAAVRPANTPSSYVIGPDDELAIVYWRDKDMSTEVRVRPDGRIAIPLINEVLAAGLTPEELQAKISEESKKYMEDASITVVVKQINSLKVFITGEVNKPGPYPLTSATTVIQLISYAGGLKEYAKSKEILIMRREADRQVSLKFNYKEVASGKNLKQNIDLKPGDTVIVP